MQPKLYLISYNNGLITDILQALHWNYFFAIANCHTITWNVLRGAAHYRARFNVLQIRGKKCVINVMLAQRAYTY